MSMNEYGFTGVVILDQPVVATVHQYVGELQEAARCYGEARGTFNGHPLVAKRGHTSEETILQGYFKETA